MKHLGRSDNISQQKRHLKIQRIQIEESEESKTFEDHERTNTQNKSAKIKLGISVNIGMIKIKQK